MELKLLQDLWNDDETVGMDEPELLRYRSNLLGRDLRLTNFGGGNTSAKITHADPLTGEPVTVLWVKGSGGDLGTIKRDGFATLYMDRLNALKNRYAGVHEEDDMADRYSLCTFGTNPRAASIDTPLHGFLPFPHVDHLHPDWAIALAACANGPSQMARLEQESGLKMVWLPWKRPGFELALWLERAVNENPSADAIILGSHGIFTWGDTGRSCYLKTIQVIDTIGQFIRKAVEEKGDRLFGGALTASRDDRHEIAKQVMPVLRGAVGNVIGHFTDNPDVLRFVNSAQAQALAWQGTSCPDHFVRTKVRPLFVDWNTSSGTAHDLLQAAEGAMITYREDYTRYYEENRVENSPAMRSPNPTVILVPGVGLFSFGRSKPEARITGEFYTNAIHVMEGATSLEDESSKDISQLEPYIQRFVPNAQRPSVLQNYVALPPNEAFGIEYWLLEEAKIRRMPAEKSLARKVALVVGASPGIGQVVGERLARESAHVVLADINLELAQGVAQALQRQFGKETCVAEQVDCTDRESVRSLMERISLQYGGVDVVVQVAAVFFPASVEGRISEAQWRKTFDVNLMGAMIVADEAQRVMTAQGTEGSIVLISSANGVVAKKGSWAYDTSKAAMNHLVRELAVEFAPKIRVNGVAPASVVEGSQQFPRDRVISSLAKYNLPFAEDEPTEALRDKLSRFYADRTLLKLKVTPVDVAEAAFLLVSPQLSRTTGQTIAVDAGLTEAFLR
jgi:rhamnose utilization protein RhaD (predicted bifunctional aldolase and dehydrogenase)/NAD(P)-dependent dehydrogenase (short-subunit alcohol dehydrogenase family)